MKKVLLSVILITLTTSCANMKSGRTQQIKVTSTPSGATCNLANDVSNTTVVTPGIAEVGRSMSTLKVACVGQGYGNGDSKVNYGANFWTLANIANFGLGYFYDLYTGSIADYPNSIEIQLKPAAQTYDGNFQMRDYNSNAVVPNAIPQPQDQQQYYYQETPQQQQLQPQGQQQQMYQQQLQQQQLQQQQMQQQQLQQQQMYQPQPQYRYGQDQVQQPQSQEQLMQEMLQERKKITTGQQ